MTIWSTTALESSQEPHGSIALGVAAIVVAVLLLVAAAAVTFRFRMANGERPWGWLAIAVGLAPFAGIVAEREFSPRRVADVRTEVVSMSRQQAPKSSAYAYFFVGTDGQRHQVLRDYWHTMRYGTAVHCRELVTDTFLGVEVGACVPAGLVACERGVFDDLAPVWRA